MSTFNLISSLRSSLEGTYSWRSKAKSGKFLLFSLDFLSHQFWFWLEGICLLMLSPIKAHWSGTTVNLRVHLSSPARAVFKSLHSLRRFGRSLCNILCSFVRVPAFKYRKQPVTIVIGQPSCIFERVSCTFIVKQAVDLRQISECKDSLCRF